MNLDTFEKLQLKEVKELIKEHCVSSLGKMLIDKLQPSGNYSVVRRKLEENKEASLKKIKKQDRFWKIVIIYL